LVRNEESAEATKNKDEAYSKIIQRHKSKGGREKIRRNEKKRKESTERKRRNTSKIK